MLGKKGVGEMKLDRRTFVGGGAVLAGLASSARASTQKTGGGRAQAKALAAIEDYVEDHRAAWGIPGMTLCVVDREGLTGVVRSGFADVDRNIRVGPSHLFQVGSITKMMTGLAIWSLIDEEKLSPEARLVDLLPDLVIRNGDDITLQHLLNHTSGIPGSTPLILDGGLWTLFEPGSQWEYSNLGYRILGKIAAQADGRSYADCVEARVLHPIGMMESTGAMRSEDRHRYAQGYEPARMDRPVMHPGPMVEAPWVDYDGGAGCVASTGSDMASFLRFLMSLADGKGGPVLSDRAVAGLVTIAADAPGWGDGVKYGSGIAQVEIDGRHYFHHTGGMVSFSSSLHVDREAGVAAFASCNVHYALNYRPRDITVHACELLRAARDGSAAPSPKPAKPAVENAAQYAGRFTAQNGDFVEIVAKGGQLKLHNGSRETNMQQIGENYFACDDDAFRMSGLEVEIDNDIAVRIWAGDMEYVADPTSGYRPSPPAEIHALAGQYYSDDRWEIPIRIYARDGILKLKSVNFFDTMTPLDDGAWRMGDSEHRARFDGMIDGKPQRLQISGSQYERRFG